jgi:hypothetical protein
MPQTFISGAESTANIPAARRVRDVGRLAYLDPDAAPFTLILQKAKSKIALNSKFEWIEKDEPSKWSAVPGGATSSATTINVTSGTGQQFAPHDIVRVPLTGEVFRVVSIATDALTVVRGVGETVGTTIAANSDVRIIGNSYGEGAAVGTEKSHQETYPFNFAEIFRLPFGATGSEAASENYTGRDRPRQRIEKSREFRILMESAFLFGERAEDTSAPGSPRRYTRGVLQWLEVAASGAVLLDAGGALTESELENFAQNVFQHVGGSGTRTLFASPLVCSVIDMLAGARLQTVPSDTTYGIAVRRLISSHGEFLVVKHRLLENGPNGNGYGGYALALEPSSMAYRFLRERDTALLMDRQAPGDDKYTDEYMAETGLQFGLPPLHGRIKGITG